MLKIICFIDTYSNIRYPYIYIYIDDMSWSIKHRQFEYAYVHEIMPSSYILSILLELKKEVGPQIQ